IFYHPKIWVIKNTSKKFLMQQFVLISCRNHLRFFIRGLSVCFVSREVASYTNERQKENQGKEPGNQGQSVYRKINSKPVHREFRKEPTGIFPVGSLYRICSGLSETQGTLFRRCRRTDYRSSHEKDSGNPS
ncbi:MAG: hypothetical protein ACO25B_10240, partial [Chitinophagaceae bacterium]